MTRQKKAKGIRACVLCGIPFDFFRSTARFHSSLCRKRWQRGHRRVGSICRRSLFILNGQLSDAGGDSTFLN
jgi:hypothetical protein